MITIRAHANPEKREALDALVIPFFVGEGAPEFACSVPESLVRAVRAPIAAGDFVAKEGQIVWVWADIPERRIALVGLGEKSGCSAESLRRLMSGVVRSCTERRYKRINLFTPTTEGHNPVVMTKALLEGLFFGSYDILAKQTDAVGEVVLITSECHQTQALTSHVEKVMRALFFARDLINGNADDITPRYLASCAEGIAGLSGRIEVRVHGREWILEQGMGLFHAVSRASSHEPQFIEMHYRGDPASPDLTVLVGKGITFDTGGLNLKGRGSIENQRKDMAGAAVVMATLQAIAQLELCCNVSVLIPTCENAIGPDAFKPGDVYTGMNKKRVEITNTDAEGRLLLADALYYAATILKASRVIDVATLTGAMSVALGGEAIGYFSNSDALAFKLEGAGQKTYERLWRFPLYEEYKEKLKSDVADIKNAHTQEAGAILAALFLQEFVQQIPWAHLDIAGVACYTEKTRYWHKLATGMGVRLLVEYFEAECRGEGSEYS